MTRKQLSYARSYTRAVQQAVAHSRAGNRGTARDWAFTARFYLACYRNLTEST